MTTPYLYERQSEYWTSRQIEEFFLDQGFELVAFPVTALHEKRLPADFLFFDRHLTKLFGFQYKALYHNGRESWPIDEAQHKELRQFPWVYYCLSELRSARDGRSALHSARIVPTTFTYASSLFPDGEGRLERYSRWGAFFQSLRQCRVGVKVGSRDQLMRLICPVGEEDGPWKLANLAADAFLADFDARRVVHFSPLLKDMQHQ